mmetsp:Transcript_30311/g.94849  ORF Transcript_30311/g.94849 Transcript_30311/m.94849 type:complete len:389 (+) Transcript_30311:480-1646(+)
MLLAECCTPGSNGRGGGKHGFGGSGCTSVPSRLRERLRDAARGPREASPGTDDDVEGTCGAGAWLASAQARPPIGISSLARAAWRSEAERTCSPTRLPRAHFPNSSVPWRRPARLEHSAVREADRTPLPSELSMLLPAHFGGLGELARSFFRIPSGLRWGSALLARGPLPGHSGCVGNSFRLLRCVRRRAVCALAGAPPIRARRGLEEDAAPRPLCELPPQPVRPGRSLRTGLVRPLHGRPRRTFGGLAPRAAQSSPRRGSAAPSAVDCGGPASQSIITPSFHHPATLSPCRKARLRAGPEWPTRQDSGLRLGSASSSSTPWLKGECPAVGPVLLARGTAVRPTASSRPSLLRRSGARSSDSAPPTRSCWLARPPASSWITRRSVQAA